MRWILPMFVVVSLLLPPTSTSSQDASPNVYEAKFEYEKALLQIRGVRGVTIAGVDGESRLVVQIDDEAARSVVYKLTGGSLLGHTLHFLVVAAPKEEKPEGPEEGVHRPENCRCPCHKSGGPGETVAEPSLTHREEAKDPYEECDWYRKTMGMPLRPGSGGKPSCHQRVGWTNNPDMVRRVIREGLPHGLSYEIPLMGSGGKIPCRTHGFHRVGDVITYTYLQHRKDCPIFDWGGRVKKKTDEMTPGD